MKRLRPVRPSGTPRVKERKRCLKCDRFMQRVQRGWKKRHQKTWLCKKCWMWYGYLDGVLKGVAGRTRTWWEPRGGWREIPEGMLLVYDGTPEPD